MDTQDNLYTEVVGDRWLSAWRVARRVIWVQTRDPKHARRFEDRKDCHLVARGVAGGYLRTYEFKNKNLAWAKQLIARYTGNAVTSELEHNLAR
jgi:hypothetical protein